MPRNFHEEAVVESLERRKSKVPVIALNEHEMAVLASIQQRALKAPSESTDEHEGSSRSSGSMSFRPVDSMDSVYSGSATYECVDSTSPSVIPVSGDMTRCQNVPGPELSPRASASSPRSACRSTVALRSASPAPIGRDFTAVGFATVVIFVIVCFTVVGSNLCPCIGSHGSRGSDSSSRDNDNGDDDNKGGSDDEEKRNDHP
jgi:hypothetical protein